MKGRRFVLGAWLSRCCLCAGLAVALTVVASPAAAQQAEMKPLLHRLDRMERELNLLQRQVYQGAGGRSTSAPGGDAGAGARGGAGAGAGEGALSPTVAARMEVRLGELETELRTLTGKLEEMSFTVDQMSARIEKLVGDVDLRLSGLERSVAARPPGSMASGAAPEGPGGAGAAGLAAVEESAEGEALAEGGAQPGIAAAAVAAAEAPSPPAELAAPSALPEGTPREQYDHVLAQLRQADYASAENGLRAFIDIHPDDALAENAQYWLGETYYVRSDYANAAVVFAEGFKKYSDGSKAPDNLLKLGMSLSRLGEAEQACKVLNEIGKKFPDISPTILERADRERTRIDCE